MWRFSNLNNHIFSKIPDHQPTKYEKIHPDIYFLEKKGRLGERVCHKYTHMCHKRYKTHIRGLPLLCYCLWLAVRDDSLVQFTEIQPLCMAGGVLTGEDCLAPSLTPSPAHRGGRRRRKSHHENDGRDALIVSSSSMPTEKKATGNGIPK